MDLFSITLYDDKESTESLVNMILKNYNNKDIFINKEIYESDKFNTIKFCVDENIINRNYSNYNDLVNAFKHCAAIGISNYIVDVLELKIIEKILKSNYYFLKPSEKTIIIEQLQKDIDNEIYDESVNIPYKVNRKAKIIYKLMDFLEDSNSLNIEGFVNFRLRNYLEDIYEVIDRVIEEYVMEKEYNEFIKLLKYFVDIQEPKIDLINIIVDKRGKYHFFDDKNRVLDDNYIRGLIDDLDDNNLNNDDLLISSLITIAPKKIIFHFANNVKNTEIIETIKNIFDKRVYICRNCKICNMNRDIKGE
ncbi:putative sporulation protein YtxC [Paramaledivibacter caminithermalis]|uniref:Putative sporulation protein YtxC n=1 Tax=Paramaledivibacter caminithermalis (strain DSM 15212 / CIP 107654 / DViRD3) TaxID=1121301 RepID=A0A1M6PYY0_PARC5|nr:putative sporulation protein YtxC [Paramaledivibacter caminithermalis]SHK13111.1 putative sporulation protein YtxC [Paramaledivibacter caminithermalis DSM 15212]